MCLSYLLIRSAHTVVLSSSDGAMKLFSWSKIYLTLWSLLCLGWPLLATIRIKFSRRHVVLSFRNCNILCVLYKIRKAVLCAGSYVCVRMCECALCVCARARAGVGACVCTQPLFVLFTAIFMSITIKRQPTFALPWQYLLRVSVIMFPKTHISLFFFLV